MGKARLLAALGAVLLVTSIASAQARLDYRQSKELKDASGYLDEVEGYVGGMEKALGGLKPGDAGVPIQTVQSLKTTLERAEQRLGYATTRLAKLPAGVAEVKTETDRAAKLARTLADLKPRIDAVAGGAQKAVEQGSGDAYKPDFDRLREINQMFGDPTILQRLPDQAIEIVKQIPHVKAERQRIAEKYADLLKQDVPASRDMKSVLAYFDQQFGNFDRAATQYAKEAPAGIDQELKQVNDLVTRGIADKNAAFFGPDGGINQFLGQAQTRLAVLTVIDPAAAKAPADKLAAARISVAQSQAALMDDIVKSNPAPQTRYTGPDTADLLAAIKAKWATSGNTSPVLATGINSNGWQRSTRWEWDGSRTWNKVDRSKLQGFVVAKATDTVANVYYINLDKDHLANDKVTAHFFSDPRQDVSVTYKVLAAKVK